MVLVLDCSVAISWLLEDEACTQSESILQIVSREGAYVPDLWYLEVCNVLVQAAKRGRLDSLLIDESLNVLQELPIKTEENPQVTLMPRIKDLAVSLQLSSYDAAYLELAERRDLPLATKDKALQKAASRIGIELFRET